MSIYRQIYEAAFGTIPKDTDGRTYEIHHIDGDHANNDISNLLCVSLQEHYDIHLAQGDFGACFMMALRMNMSPEEKSNIARLSALKRIADGTHHLLGGEISRKTTQRRIADGTHNFCGSNLQLNRVANGSHPFLGGDIARKSSRKRVEDGTHHLLNPPVHTCPHCGKEGKGGIMKRWHFNNCVNKPSVKIDQQNMI